VTTSGRLGRCAWGCSAGSIAPSRTGPIILYADELLKEGKRADALAHLQVAERNAGDSANVHYNLGLLYIDLKDYERSQEHARKAYELGAQLPGLRNKLAEAGKWRE
jgi:tetratricopeptide (TPR) repeat protein